MLLQLVTTGLDGNLSTPHGSIDQLTPVDMTPLGDGRNLVLTLSGIVRLLKTDGTLAPGVYLDTFNADSFPASGEYGPTSVLAHPDFLNAGSAGFGKFYTLTNEQPGTATADLGEGSHHQNVINEWTVQNPADLNATTFSGTSRELLRFDRPGPFHDVFDMEFDANRLMYITSGDGGGNAYGANRRQNAQNPANVFGTILRIDPVNTSGPGLQTSASGKYGIPTSNFGVTNGPAMNEAFAYGFRSPYRISVDLPTGDVWIGDVGEGSREEIDLVVNGGNYGWGNREGTLGPQPPGGIDPKFELLHNDAGVVESVTITGGVVSRDPDLPELMGKYIFADFGEGDANDVGELYYGLPGTTAASSRDDFFKLIIDTTGAPLPERIYSINQDFDGTIYILGGPDRFAFNNGEPGAILKLIPTAGAPNGVAGDVNQDGMLDSLDSAAFVAGWLTTGHEGAFAKYTHGDLNFDGITDQRDAFILHQAFAAPTSAAISNGSLDIPEPPTTLLSLSAFAFLVVCIASLAKRRREFDLLQHTLGNS